jgi:hypothetical protein
MSQYAVAASTKLKLDITLTSLQTNEKSSFSCEVFQALDWSVSTNFWKCYDGDAIEGIKTNVWVRRGVNFDLNVRSLEYSLGTNGGLGNWLLPLYFPEVETIKSGDLLQIYLYRSQPVLGSKDVLIESNIGHFLLSVELASYL